VGNDKLIVGNIIRDWDNDRFTALSKTASLISESAWRSSVGEPVPLTQEQIDAGEHQETFEEREAAFISERGWVYESS